MKFLLACVIGCVLDLIFGDPRWLYHPVRLIGKLIELLEKLLRRIFPDTERGLLIAGGVLCVLVVGISTAVPYFILYGLERIHPLLRLAVESFWCYQLLAARALQKESGNVYRELKNNDLPKARYAVSMIVGRDTESLDEVGVTKAAVETVAENTSDGVIAPLLFMMLGGATLGFFYKAVNTMDSMVGYKNDVYLFFGRAAAKFDDVLNFIPARISALMMIAAAYLTGLDGKNAAYIYKRDHGNHASPNSAQTESVCAGALDVQLAGDAFYFGKKYEKPTIGDAIRPIEVEDIVRSWKLMYGTGVLCVVLCAVIHVLCWKFI